MSRDFGAPLSAAIFLGLAASAMAAPVTVPNADFSIATNDGSVGGGLLGGTGSLPIGSGPWSGTFAGVLGELAPPLLTIGSGQATISGIAVVQLLGINNNGAFIQTLGAQWAPLKHYVLAADVTAVTPLLIANVSSSGNIGMALSSGASTYSSTETSLEISLTQRQSNSYHLALGYDSSPSDAGNIGISLFSSPTGVLAVNLISEVAFNSVYLTQAPIPALPAASIGSAGGTPQAATVNTAFSAPLVVSVEDAEGDPLNGVMVTFTAPVSGPSAGLSSTTIMTDVGGRATVTGTANGIDGTYPVIATVDGVQLPATFNLTNTGAGQPTITSVAGGNQPQSATTGNPFACMLAIQVINGSTPAEGATVMFSAPTTGASATLEGAANTGNTVTETTDANGVAIVSATANATAGSYDVTAAVTALQSGPVSPPVQLAIYPLTNLAAGDRPFSDGFETIPAPCASF
ncbi:MAG: hypothetical protein P4L92_01105 [Rudaea sp.]|nr:hypothetical protein [Rudaea sp.]